ncbi:hypothetical protein SNEBB_010670 [Seison nebaliae]|nr:hypothetical protein SNEBB_010670 [Seison nebaliae]
MIEDSVQRLQTLEKKAFPTKSPEITDDSTASWQKYLNDKIELTDTVRKSLETITKEKRIRTIAIHDFKARDGDELSFKIGDEIEVDFSSKHYGLGFWYGRLISDKNVKGYFPHQHVKLPILESLENDGKFRKNIPRQKSSYEKRKFSRRSREQKRAQTSTLQIPITPEKTITVDEKSEVKELIPILEETQLSPIDDTVQLRRLPKSQKKKRLDKTTSILLADEVEEFPRDQFNLDWKDGFCGAGAYGSVYSAKWNYLEDNRKNSIKVAVKIPNQSFTKNDNKDEVVKEASYCRSHNELSHKNIVKIFGIVEIVERHNYGIIMELCAGGTVFDAIHTLHNLSSSVIINWALQVASGLKYLHHHCRPAIIHRDMKSPNILIYEQMDNIRQLDDNELKRCILKLSDFGVAKEIDFDICSREIVSKIVGTNSWTAPETFREQCYTKYTDVWAFGVYAWELLTCEIPYKDLIACQITYGVAVGKIQLIIPSDCPDDYRTLLENCWHYTPKMRWDFTRIYEELLKMSSVSSSETFKIKDENFNGEIEEEFEPQLDSGYNDNYLDNKEENMRILSRGPTAIMMDSDSDDMLAEEHLLSISKQDLKAKRKKWKEESSAQLRNEMEILECEINQQREMNIRNRMNMDTTDTLLREKLLKKEKEYFFREVQLYMLQQEQKPCHKNQPKEFLKNLLGRVRSKRTHRSKDYRNTSIQRDISSPTNFEHVKNVRPSDSKSVMELSQLIPEHKREGESRTASRMRADLPKLRTNSKNRLNSQSTDVSDISPVKSIGDNTHVLLNSLLVPSPSIQSSIGTSDDSRESYETASNLSQSKSPHTKHHHQNNWRVENIIDSMKDNDVYKRKGQIDFTKNYIDIPNQLNLNQKK